MVIQFESYVSDVFFSSPTWDYLVSPLIATSRPGWRLNNIQSALSVWKSSGEWNFFGGKLSKKAENNRYTYGCSLHRWMENPPNFDGVNLGKKVIYHDYVSL